MRICHVVPTYPNVSVFFYRDICKSVELQVSVKFGYVGFSLIVICKSWRNMKRRHLYVTTIWPSKKNMQMDKRNYFVIKV